MYSDKVQKDIQRSVESKADIFLNKIISEFELNFNKKPRVYYLSKDLSVEELDVSRSFDEETFFSYRDAGKSYLDLKEGTIFIAKDINHIVAEEVGHFIHLNMSRLKYEHKSKREVFFTSVLIEMLGFFSSKLITPTRSAKKFKKYGDLVYVDECKLNEIKRQFKQDFVNQAFGEFLIYQQGYGLGEKLFKKYSEGNFDKKEISGLFSNKLSEKNSSSNLFTELKIRLY